MGSCYSVAYSWYAWMAGSQITSAGMLRYRNEPVDGETTIEFQHLVDADEELLELGHGNQPVTLLTDEERRQLQGGRYDEILVHSTRDTEEVDGQTQKVEQDLRLEEEAYYEARREAARAARQAQALEASRAAAATVAAAQATHTAMLQNADIFSSAALPTVADSARPVVAAPPADTSVRQAAQLTAESQLEEFARTSHQQSSTAGAQDLGSIVAAQQRATSGQASSSSPNEATTSAQREATSDPPIPDTVETSRLAGALHNSSQDTPDAASTTAPSFTEERTVVDSTSLASDLKDTQSSSSQPAAAETYTIIDDDDDEDFDSFLESVKAKNFGPNAKGVEIARGTSPPPIENGDDDFTAFEESVR